MKYIITADDYGISPIIDDAIQHAITVGCVTSVAGFANGLDDQGQFSVNKLKNLKQTFPHVSVGVHFTLTSGKAVSPHSNSLTRNNSRFFKAMLSQNPNNMQLGELEEELNAQIQVFEDADLEIQHFSDHVGILTLIPATAMVYYKVVKEYCLRKGREIPVRNPMLTAAYIPEGCLNNSKMFSLGRLGGGVMGGVEVNAQSMKNHLIDMQREGMKTTDYFIEHLYKNPKRSTLVCIFNETPDQKNPLVQHRFDSSPIAEIVTHLAVRPENYQNNNDYNEKIAELKKHKGIAIQYLKGQRHTEYKTLIKELPTMLPSIELVAYPS